MKGNGVKVMNDVLIKDVEELNAAVENVSYALYGAGRVARNVIKYLAKNGMRRPNKIYVSDESENPQEIMGIPVIMLSKCDFDVSGSVLLCCAKENLHEEFKKEIEHYTFKKIYFVSDNLYEQLMYINGDFEIENYYELIKIQKQNEEIKRRQCKGFAKVGIEYFIINIL